MTQLGKNYKLVGDKIVKDHAKIEAKHNVSTRIKRRTSKRIRPVRNPGGVNSG
jgi:hypothetical protein